MKKLKRNIIFTLFIGGALFILFSPKGLVDYFILEHQFSKLKIYREKLLNESDSLFLINQELTKEYNIEKVAREKFRFIYPKEKIIIFNEN